MPVEGRETKVGNGADQKDAFVIEFTNGAKEQLETLKEHFKQKSTLEVVELAISLLENFRQEKENITLCRG